MLYHLIQIQKGKSTIVMTDSLPKVNDRKKTLSASLRGKSIRFKIESADEDAKKFKKKPHDGSYVGGDYASYPRKVH